LAEVESMLELTLFDRSARGTEPTASGTAGRTCVGSMVVAMPVLLSRAVALLKQRSTRATVLVEEGDLTHLLPKLRLSELDVFVGRLEPGYASPDLLTEPLYEEPMVAVVAADHALARKAKPRWADLAAIPCVMPPPVGLITLRGRQLTTTTQQLIACFRQANSEL
jgi:DNA-binding transcriptional LysR family regulator